MNSLSFIEALSGRLADTNEGFRLPLLRTERAQISIRGEASAGTVAAGATVAGVRVAVHVHGPARRWRGGIGRHRTRSTPHPMAASISWQTR